MAAEAKLNMGDIKDLAPLAKKVNARTDALNGALQTIQEKLNALNLGIEVWLDDSLGEDDWKDVTDTSRSHDIGEPTGQREYYAEELGYGRHGEQWALLVRTHRYVDEPDNWGNRQTEGAGVMGVKPLLSATRGMRISVVPLIPKLVDKLKEEAGAALERIDQAQKIAESLE